MGESYRMIVEDKAYIETPPDDTPLMHYLNLYQLLAILNSNGLCFSTVALYEDIAESTLTEPSYDNVYSFTLLEDNSPVRKDEHYLSRQQHFRHDGKIIYDGQWHKDTFAHLIDCFSRHFMFTHCWAMAESENILMWDRYRHHGSTLAIRTTVGKMKNAFAQEACPLHIGKIQYKDYETEHITGFEKYSQRNLSDPNTIEELFYQPVFHKQKIFESENEVRIVIDYKYIIQKHLQNTYLTDIPFYNKNWGREEDILPLNYDTSFTYFRVKSNEIVGIPHIYNVKMNIDELIKHVILSPYTASYGMESIQGMMHQYGLNPNKVIHSSIELKS